MPQLIQNGDVLTGTSNDSANILYSEPDGSSKNVQEKIGELNNSLDSLGKSVSDGKTLVANAITAKGISTATDASFQTIAENIGKLVNGNLSLVTWGTSTTFEYDCEIGDILVFTSMSTIYVYSGLEELFNKGVGNDHHVAVCKCTSTHIKCGGRTDKDFSELYALFRIS